MISTEHRAGRILAIVNVVAALGYFAFVLVIHGFELDAIFDALGILTRIGMLYFIAAFIARPLDDLVHLRATKWLVANRRYLGLSFAAWHLVHWPILVCFVALMGPRQFWDNFSSFFAPAIAILLVITAMAATSNDRAQRWLGMRAWSAFHTIGLYTIWVWAFQTYLGRMPEYADTHDHVYLALLIGALAARWIALAKRGLVALLR